MLYLRDRFPELAVVILSQVVEPSLVATLTGGQERGFGYLLKDRVLDTQVFLDQLATVVDGGTAIDPVVVERCLRHSRPRLQGLTEREVEVLGLVASGRSNAGVATDLVISRRTVDAHLRSIFTKLGIEADPDGNQRVLAALDWLSSQSQVPGPVGAGGGRPRAERSALLLRAPPGGPAAHGGDGHLGAAARAVRPVSAELMISPVCTPPCSMAARWNSAGCGRAGGTRPGQLVGGASSVTAWPATGSRRPAGCRPRRSPTGRATGP